MQISEQQEDVPGVEGVRMTCILTTAKTRLSKILSLRLVKTSFELMLQFLRIREVFPRCHQKIKVQLDNAT